MGSSTGSGTGLGFGPDRFEYVDEAMERAWTRKNEWQQIGALAKVEVLKQVPEDPGLELANKLKKLIS